MDGHQSLTGAKVKHEGEDPIVLLEWFCVVVGPARGDLGGVNFGRQIEKGCLWISPSTMGVVFSDDDDDDESDAEELWGSSCMWLSSSKFRCSESMSGEQFMGEMSQRRFDGLTPGSVMPSVGPGYSSQNNRDLEFQGWQWQRKRRLRSELVFLQPLLPLFQLT